MTRFRLTALLASIAVGTLGCTSAARSNPSAPAGKALIELGWDAPTPPHIRANIASMEKQPFQGTMVNLTAGKTIFNKTAYPDSAYTQDRVDLAATKFTTLTENFVTIWSAREEGWTWFDDKEWSAAEINARNFAKTAKTGRFKGFIFDPEPYGTNPWSYNATLYPDRTFAEVQDKVRQRGASFLKAIQAEMPDVMIMTLFGVSHVRAQTEEQGALEKAEWVLLASFLDGMLDVINPKAQLIDGNEGSYYYTTPKQFDDFRAHKQSSRELVSPENRPKYDSHVSGANAVFADGLLNLLQSPRFFGYYVDSDANRLKLVEHHTYHALRTSDRYVWVYNEAMDWWGSKGKGVDLPKGLAELLVRARQTANAGKPLDFSIEPFMTTATARFDAKVMIAGRITRDGKGLGGVTLTSGPQVNGYDPSCPPSNPDGYFGCTMPGGWTGTITPSMAGLTFDPPQFNGVNVTANVYGFDFQARPS